MPTRIVLVVLLLSLGRGSLADEPIAALATPPAAAPSGMSCSTARPVAPRSLMSDPAFKGAMVVLEVEIVPPGVVNTVSVVESSGHFAWEEAAVDAMKKVTCTLGAPVTEKIVARQSFSISTQAGR